MDMFNLFWFLLLGLISSWFILYTYKNTDFRKNLSVYFFTMGLSFIMEYAVLIIGNAYSYYPNVFSNKWYDNVFGSSLSQAFFIPSVLMGIAGFCLKIKWIMLIIASVYAIEEFFLWIGIYEHHWWRSWYTAVILLVAAYFIKWWRKQIENPSPAVRFITIYMAITTIIQIISFYFAVLFKTHWYTVGWFDSKYRDHIAFNTLICLIYSVLITVLVLYLYNYLSLSVLFLGDYLFNSLLIKLEVLHTGPYWHHVFFGVIIVIFAVCMKRLASYLFPVRI